jgi:hypothetical protein
MRTARNYLLLSALLCLALVPAIFAQPGGNGTSVCRQIAWSPEALTFYGDTKTVAAKVSSLENDLQDRRMYLFVVESANTAEISLFERTEGRNVAVSRWTGDSLGEVTNRVSKVLLENQGAECAGKLTKELLSQIGKANTSAISAPATLRAAFQHAAEQPENNYIRVSIFLLC